MTWFSRISNSMRDSSDTSAVELCAQNSLSAVSASVRTSGGMATGESYPVGGRSVAPVATSLSCSPRQYHSRRNVPDHPLTARKHQHDPPLRHPHAADLHDH